MWANRALALGHGTPSGGAKPSTADGHLVAFGGTEELLRYRNLVPAPVGRPDGPPFDRHTGNGYVAAHPGAYGDAIGRGSTVHLCIVETSGAVNATTERLVRLLGKSAESTVRVANPRRD